MILEKKHENSNHRNHFVIALFSAFAAILTTSLNNIGVIGIRFDEWFLFAMIITVLVATVSIILFSYSLFDSYRKACEKMIYDLNEILLTIED